MTNLVGCDLDAFMRQIHETELPNSVDATERLLMDQSAAYSKLKDEILATGKHGENLLDEIRQKTEMSVERVGNISSIERLVDNLRFSVRRNACCSQFSYNFY